MKLQNVFGILLFSGILYSASAQSPDIDHWESAVYAEDTWHYFAGITQGPPAGWQSPAYNDGSWPEGRGGFGYGDGDDSTLFPAPPNPVSVFARIGFVIQDTAMVLSAVLNMDYDDGFVAWINGIEVARSNLGLLGDHPAYNVAATDHEALMYQGQDPPAFLVSKQKLRACLVNGINTLAVQVNNSGSSSSDMSCRPYFSMGLKSPGLTYRSVPDWFEMPNAGFTGSHLPLVVIETGSSAIIQDVKTMVTLGIIDRGPGELNTLEDDWNNYNGKAGIEIRGSSSTGFPKKNYGIELWKPDATDTAYSLMGLPSESDWILHGPYSDKSLIRNYLAYSLARGMGHYASRTRFCELFIDGQYQGVYVLLERIKRDSARVDIANLKDTDLTGDQLTGGYIVKIDRTSSDYSDGWFSPFMGTGSENTGPFFAFHYPHRDKIVTVQKNYIRNRITEFETALHGSLYLDPYQGYKTYIDISSFVDYFILVEMSKNTDGYRLSTFLHKDRDSKDPRIHMGPIWDYDLAFGNADYYDAFKTSGWNYLVTSDGWGTPFWWKRMMSDPYFVNQLYCRWHEFRQGVLSDDSIAARIDTAMAKLGTAADRNFVQWPIHGIYVWPNPYVGNTVEEDISYMKNWIKARAAWMDANIPGYTCLSGTNDISGQITFGLRAYPVPAPGEVTLEIQNERGEELMLEVFNFTGQLMYSKRIERDIMITEKLSLRPGAYLVRVSGKTNVRTAKILIE
jgi:hypothetical protein